MPKVSLIIPVYNVENYIEKCLDSVINQTLKDIEIIIVNDGSKDTSKEKIEKYTNFFWESIEDYFLGSIPAEVAEKVFNKTNYKE